MRQFVTLLVCCFSSLQCFAGSFIDWNYDGKAYARGVGCTNENAAFITAGDEISVIFSRMEINLQPDSKKREVRIACKVGIPAKIVQGKFVSELHEQFVYGYVRNEGAEGEILVTTKFEQENGGRISTHIPTPGYDRLTEPYIAQQVVTKWRTKPSWCLKKELKTNLVTDLVIRAHRSNTSSSIVITTDGFDVRYDATVVEGRCT